MRQRTIALAAASLLLVSCALISGASDLVVGPDATDGGGVSAEAGPVADSATEDVVSIDATAEIDAPVGRAACDEPGLVGRWTFDEGGGAVVHDCTSFHHDGRVDGGNWAEGERDGGMAFDGGWVGFGNPPGLQLTGPLTACAWIRPAALPPADPARGYIVGKLLNPNGGGWRFATARSAATAPVAIALNVPDSDGGFHETKGGTMALLTWSHVCAVFSGTSESVFVNGVQVGTTPTAFDKITITNDELRIGVRADGQEPYDGSVDDVRIYARALSVPEIAALASP